MHSRLGLPRSGRGTVLRITVIGVLLECVVFTVFALSSQDSTLQMCGNSGTPSPVQHVVIVMAENEKYPQVVGNPATPYQSSTLRFQCGLLSNMHGVTHWSEANYRALIGGTFSPDALT